MNLVWFRTDLRMADNPALLHALETGESTLALFVVHPEQHQHHGEAPQKLEFIKAHINDLVKRLGQLNIQSLIEVAPWYSDVPALIEKIINQHQVKKLFFNANYWLNEMKRDEAVIQMSQQSNVDVKTYHSQYLLPPGSIRKSDDSMYHVFTPYKNKFIEVLKQRYQLPLSIPSEIDADVKLPDLLPEEFNSPQWPVGEKAAVERLKKFAKNNDYQQERDFPAIDGTSSLSPYLAIGVISAQQCLAHVLKQQGEPAFNSTWVSELIWRDYYNDLMYEYPRLAMHKTFKPNAVDHWYHSPELLDQWRNGQTGFPIVDAGMRQLLAEGWMHNRVRMIVASFLCKLCLIDWRQGEAHFMAHLLDGDLASNNGGWQWSSATGCDAAPYFRIFNPTTQSKKFDPDGSYIKKYVPELRDVGVKEIHDPKSNTRSLAMYPQPVIDYKSARQQALAWYKDNPVN
ncbi:cryptochrome/photolyase family protein [Marinicella litoralis]|uniref:Deoxyribodipyrimidine photo-lyase type I n=1 Tax=Marinicella litoralis TaxID=644220 RepID=A0A4R6XF59_9GAMM|nr:FAD-binding domain-containing protein [Marinicella litoralis]TDR16869.1 deoxyribodipyrimidine photo-lyase type I [Marinicella litoralis]